MLDMRATPAIDHQPRNLGKLLKQTPAQLTNTQQLFTVQHPRQGKGSPHTDNLVSGQRARTQAAFVPTSMDLRLKQRPGALTNVQGTNALGAIDFVGRE
ncbi:hypothetical protein D3C76_1428450 [compost metagenome]